MGTKQIKKEKKLKQNIKRHIQIYTFVHTQKYHKYTRPCLLYTQKTFKVEENALTQHYDTKNIQRFHGIHFLLLLFWSSTTGHGAYK